MPMADALEMALVAALGRPTATAVQWYRWPWGGYALEVETPTGRFGLGISTHGKTEGLRAPSLDGVTRRWANVDVVAVPVGDPYGDLLDAPDAVFQPD